DGEGRAAGQGRARGRVRDRRGRRGVVDHLRRQRRVARVAGVVGDDCAEVVRAVADRRRVPVDRPRRAGVGADRRPVAAASARAEIVTLVPVWKLPPSTLYSVWSMPEPASTPVGVAVPSADGGCAGALLEVAGAVLSTRTFVTALEVVELPALSVAVARRS